MADKKRVQKTDTFLQSKNGDAAWPGYCTLASYMVAGFQSSDFAINLL
jgi:hypothetical protein